MYLLYWIRELTETQLLKSNDYQILCIQRLQPPIMLLHGPLESATSRNGLLPESF